MMGQMLELPRLSIKERDRRWQMIRDAMKTEKLDCLVIWGSNGVQDNQVANVRYVTGIGGGGEQAFVVFPLDSEPTCYVWGVTKLGWWPKAQNWITDIQARNPTFAASVVKRVKELGFEKRTIGIVGLAGLRDRDGTMLYEVYSQILRGLPDANLVNATPLIETIRLIKSDEEIQMLERASGIGDLVCELLARTAKPGVKECEVFGKMLECMVSNGGEVPVMILWGAGPEPLPHPFNFPTTRVLQKGDIINLEFHTKYNGYLAHQERTVSLGQPRREYRHLYDVSLDIFRKTAEKLKPGLKIGELPDIIREPIFKAGLGYIEAGIHGHGLESGEYPMFVYPPAKAPVDLVAPQVTVGEGKLEAGMVVALNLDLIDPNWKGGNTGTMLSDTFLITEAGSRRLGKYPLDIIVSA